MWMVPGVAAQPGQHPAAELWRNLATVDLSFYKSSLSQELRAEGRDEGETRRAAEDILDVFDARGIDVPDAVRTRITDCTDPETLRRRDLRGRAALTSARADPRKPQTPKKP